MLRRRTSTIRGRTAPAMAALALVLAGPGLVSFTFAQAPGPESFAKPPSTPAELWDATDYLVGTGQAKVAVSYLDRFLKSAPSDDVLLKIRDRYGVGSVLRLSDFPETKPFAKPALDLFNAALRRHATDPARIEQSIDALSKSRAEQDYGVDQLKQAGPYAIPALIRRINDPNLAKESRALIVANIGRLDKAVVPALVAALGASDPAVASDVARALGAIGDPRALPFLTYPAARGEAPSFREAASLAIQKITGKAFDYQPKTPARVLSDEAWKYERHQIKFDSDPTIIWVWGGDAPIPQTVPKTVAESILGGRFAREALAIDPADAKAQSALVSLSLEKAVERSGIGLVSSNDPSGAFAAALASGPAVLTDVLQTAVKDGKGELAAVAALALGRVSNSDPAFATDVVSPLVAALAAPDRRVQYAAASALVGLNPSKPFVGSSRVVPLLSRFVTNRGLKAMILDGNQNRGNGVASTLQALGYQTEVVDKGIDAFREVADSADVEVILIEPTTLQGAWNARDTMANLRADSRTAGIPIVLYGPMALENRLRNLLADHPRVGFVVTPTNPETARATLNPVLAKMGTRPLSDDERAGFAQGSASLLSLIASRPNGPFAADLASAEPALSQALSIPSTAPGAISVLGDVPGNDAQQSLANVVLDTSRPAPLRFEGAKALEHSIQKFGAMLSPSQEKKLVVALDTEADPALQSAMSAVFGALRPSPEASGKRLAAFRPRPAAAPQPAKPIPVPADAPAPEEKP